MMLEGSYSLDLDLDHAPPARLTICNIYTCIDDDDDDDSNDVLVAMYIQCKSNPMKFRL